MPDDPRPWCHLCQARHVPYHNDPPNVFQRLGRRIARLIKGEPR